MLLIRTMYTHFINIDTKNSELNKYSFLNNNIYFDISSIYVIYHFDVIIKSYFNELTIKAISLLLLSIAGQQKFNITTCCRPFVAYITKLIMKSFEYIKKHLNLN